MNIDELNEKICNSPENLSPLKGFEIIAESLVDKVYDLFGKNMLLSVLYQVGSAPGKIIASRMKEKYNKEEFEILEALIILMNELTEYYSIQIRDVEEFKNGVKIIVENHCFLRESIKKRESLDYGKSFCRVNKGYFETAFKELLGNKIRKVDISFVCSDPEKDVCVEEIKFYF